MDVIGQGHFLPADDILVEGDAAPWGDAWPPDDLEEHPDILISDDYLADDDASWAYYGDDDFEGEAWVPLEAPVSSAAIPPAGGRGLQQQIILAGSGLAFGADQRDGFGKILTDSYCQLHVEECAARNGDLTVNRSCIFAGHTNCTWGVDLAQGEGPPGYADYSGMGLTLLMVFVILVALHLGWEGVNSEFASDSKSKDKVGRSSGDEDSSQAKRSPKDSKGGADSADSKSSKTQTKPGKADAGPAAESKRDGSTSKPKTGSDDAGKTDPKSGKDRKPGEAEAKNRSPSHDQARKDVKEKEQKKIDKQNEAARGGGGGKSERPSDSRAAGSRSSAKDGKDSRAAEGKRGDPNVPKTESKGTKTERPPDASKSRDTKKDTSSQADRSSGKSSKDRVSGGDGRGTTKTPSGVEERDKGKSSRAPAEKGASPDGPPVPNKGTGGADTSGSGGKTGKSAAAGGEKTRSGREKKDGDRGDGKGPSEGSDVRRQAEGTRGGRDKAAQASVGGGDQSQVQDAKSKLREAQRKEKEAKASGDKAKYETSRNDRKKAEDDYKKLKETSGRGSKVTETGSGGKSGAGSGAPSGASADTSEDAAKLAAAKAKLQEAQKREKEAKASGDRAKHENARQDRKRAEEDYKKLKENIGKDAKVKDAKVDGASGTTKKTESGNAQGDNQSKTDWKVKEAEAELAKAENELAQAKKAKKSPAEIQKAREKRDEARKKRDAAKGATEPKARPTQASSSDSRLQKAESKLQDAKDNARKAAKTGDPKEIADSERDVAKAQTRVDAVKAAVDAADDKTGSWPTYLKVLVLMALLAPVLGVLSRTRTPLSSQTRLGTTPSAFTRPPAAQSGHSWVASSKPAAVHINNINSQGQASEERIVSVGESTAANGPSFEENVSSHQPPPLPMGETVLDMYRTVDSDRFLAIAASLLFVFSPLISDSMRDWPQRGNTTSKFLAPMYQWGLMGLVGLIILISADWHYGVSVPSVSRILAETGILRPPVVVAPPPTAEDGAKIVIRERFGLSDGQSLLPGILAILAVAGIGMRSPIKDVPKPVYVRPTLQLAYLIGATLLAMVMWGV